jgi:hypothetical protein
MLIRTMPSLVAQLIESEIRLGFGLVAVARLSLKMGNAAAFEEARNRAESVYLRARAHGCELTDYSKRIQADRLLALRSAIDELPESPPTAAVGSAVCRGVPTQSSVAIRTVQD